MNFFNRRRGDFFIFRFLCIPLYREGGEEVFLGLWLRVLWSPFAALLIGHRPTTIADFDSVPAWDNTCQ